MTNTKVDPTNNAPSAKKLGKRELDKVAGGQGGIRHANLCECVPGTSAVNTAVSNT